MPDQNLEAMLISLIYPLLTELRKKYTFKKTHTAQLLPMAISCSF